MVIDQPPPSVVVALRAAGCVHAEEEAALLAEAAHDDVELQHLVARRCAGEPLEHVVGSAWFCGVRVVVGPGAFVPRPRTEALVREALDELGRRGAARPHVVVDVGCGVGAIGAALRARRPDLDLLATECDPVAAQVARLNLGDVVLVGDLLEPLPHRLLGAVDVVVANLPYVPTASIALLPREARDHEPLVALDGGADGLDQHRRLAAQLPRWLANDGVCLVECSPAQAETSRRAFAAHGLVSQAVVDGEQEVATVLARLP